MACPDREPVQTLRWAKTVNPALIHHGRCEQLGDQVYNALALTRRTDSWSIL
jgi:hypothetical protein